MSGLEDSQTLLKAKNNTVEFYFVRHAESCSNISDLGVGKISHPPLSYKGIQQAINLGINNKIIDMDFDKYYCSPSLRTIMTACLALRRKSIYKSITLTLNPYLIEHKNFADVISADQQNAIVKSENLNNMIKYIKLWFEQKYFDNYIDYEFVHIMYDLVALLYLNNHLDKYKDQIKELLVPIKQNRTETLIKFIESLKKIETSITTKNKIIINYKTGNIYDIYDNILLFLNDNIVDIDNNFTIYQDLNNKLDYKKIEQQMLMIITTPYYFMNNIKIEYFIPDTDPNPPYSPNIKHFIEMVENLQSDKKIQKILCFTHGEALKHHFKFKTKLENTEIVHYNTNDSKIIRIKNNNIVINEDLVINTCGHPTIGTQMFKIINKYFNEINYKVTDDNIDDNFKVLMEEDKIGDDWEKVGGGRYKHKYLKYKYKYLNYKKIKLNN